MSGCQGLSAPTPRLTCIHVCSVDAMKWTCMTHIQNSQFTIYHFQTRQQTKAAFSSGGELLSLSPSPSLFLCVCVRECVGVCERTWKPRSHVPLQNKMKSNLWSFAVKSYSPHVSQWGQRGGGSHSTGVVLMQICREGKIKTIQCGKSAFSLLISTAPPSARCRINNLVRVKLYTGSK